MWLLVAWLLGCGAKDGGTSGGGSALCNVDADGDGFGSSTAVPANSCADDGVADNADDCDDEASSIHPGATETSGDGIDQDCDGNDLCYEDLDGDGYGGVARLVRDCAADGLVGRDGDCNESDPAVHPGVQEIPADGVDQDCDGGEACFTDSDGDGFSGALAFGSDLDCTDPGEAIDADDCLDDDSPEAPVTFPGAAPNDSITACMTDADEDEYGSFEPAAGVTPGTDRCDDDGTTTCLIHVGYDVQFPGTNLCWTLPDYMMGLIVTVEHPMTVTALGHIAAATGANFRMALYTDDEGPDALVLEAGPEVVIDGVQELPVSSTTIAAGDYWIMAIYDARVALLPYQDSGPHGSGAYPACRGRSHISFDGALPDPFGNSTEGVNRAWNYYIVGY